MNLPVFPIRKRVYDSGESEANQSGNGSRNSFSSTSIAPGFHAFRGFWKQCVTLVFFAAVCVTSLSGKKTDEIDFGELSLEELFSIDIDSVVGASRYEQKISEAPSTISVVTQEDIQRYGHETLLDVLNSLHGFYQSNDRNYGYLGVRGFGRPGDFNSRVLLLIDGHRTSDSVYDASLLGTDQYLNIDLIERVEVVRGPSSSVYGSNAFFGAINVLTRSPASIGGVETSAEVASFDTYKVRFTYGDEFKNGLGVLFSASYVDSAGPSKLYFPEFDDPATNFGIAENGDDLQAKRAFTKLQYHDFTLTGAYVDREKGFPTASYDSVFNDRRNRTRDEEAFVDLAYNKTFDNDFNLQARASYNQYEYDGIYIYDWSDEGDQSYLVPNNDFVSGKWWGVETHVNGRFLDDRLTMSGGFEYRDNFKQDQENYDNDSGDIYLYLDSQESSTVLGVYTQADLKLNDKTRLSAGVRHDNYSTFGSTTNPRLGLIYQAAEPTTIKLLYGTAFRAPNAYELYYEDDGLSQKANPGLGPEEIDTLEFVIEHQLNDQYRASFSAFKYEIDGLISLEEDPSDELLIFENLDQANSKGLEVEFQAHFENGLIGRASYSWQETEDTTTGKILTNSPQHLAKFKLSAPVYGENTFAGFELHYNSSRRTIGGGETGDFWLLNATLFSRELADGLEISATIRNLLDTRYGYPGSAEHIQDIIYQNGRTFGGKLTFRF